MPQALRLLFILLMVTALSIQMAQAGPAPLRPDAPEMDRTSQQGLDELPLPGRYAVSAAIGQDRSDYHLTKHNGILRGRNQSQSYEMGFSGTGVEIGTGHNHWGLSLVSWGYGDDQSPVAAAPPMASGNRVEYRRGLLTEWYINGPYGLQQGFTLESVPSGKQPEGQPLRLCLDLQGGLTARVDRDQRSLSIHDPADAMLYRYTGLTVLDADGREARAWLEVQGDRLIIAVNDQGLRYPLLIDPVIQKAKLTGFDLPAEDIFGISVSLSGDTMVVGAPGDNDNGPGSGSVYVFVKPESGWADLAQPVKLTASDGRHGDGFGRSVSISGDVISVGAPWASPCSVANGAVYVFVKPAGGWTQMTETAKLVASDTTITRDLEQLGYSVSISGDTIVAGAWGDKSCEDFSGSAYVFVKPAGGWANMTETAKLTASDCTFLDNFGRSVAVDGDVVVVGVPKDQDLGFCSGSAYVFVRPDTGWTSMTETAKLTTTDGEEWDLFGTSVSISGVVVVIGAPGNYGSAYKSGAAYVFVKPDNGWSTMTQTAKLTPSAGVSVDNFGDSVSINGDTIVVGASDGGYYRRCSLSAYVFVKPVGGWSNMTPTATLTTSEGVLSDCFGASVYVSGDIVVAGAPFDDDNGYWSGSAFVFVKSETGWADMTQTSKLTGFEPSDNDLFGLSVSVDEGTVVVGAPGDGNYCGAAYVFEKPVNGWTNMNQTAKLTALDGAAGARFGSSVAISGDMVVIGAPWGDYFGLASGSAYVFVKPETGWADMTQTARLIPSGGVADIAFGYRVSIDGNVAVVGAPGVENNSGSAYLFVKPETGWANMIQTAKLTPSDGAEYDNFGFFLSISGDTVLVGSLWDDDNVEDSGSAYIFVKPDDGWTNMTQTAKLTASDGITVQLFGQSLSLDGDVAVIGAPWDDDHGWDSGSAYVFVKPETGWTDMTQTAKLTGSDTSEGDCFGYSVSISGDKILIGANWDDNQADDAGSAYVFVKPTGGWTDMTQTAKLTKSGGQEDDEFGAAVSINGNTIVVGTYRDIYQDNTNGIMTGSAYVFDFKQNIGMGYLDLLLLD